MAEINPPGDPSRRDGFLCACEGILRARFGRRPFTAAARAIEQLAREEREKELHGEWASVFRWREALAILRGRWSVALRAASLVIVVSATLLLFSPGSAPSRIAIGQFAAIVGQPTLRHSGQPSTLNPQLSTPVFLGDRIETGDADKAEIKFSDGSKKETGSRLPWVGSNTPALNPKNQRNCTASRSVSR